jgi:Holliday junction resolvase-like predicted endonuclease
MFVVKLKTKGSSCISYSNKVFIVTQQKLEKMSDFKNLLMSKDEAKAVALDIIINKPNGIDLEFISVIEVVCSNSLRPLNVIFYREF